MKAREATPEEATFTQVWIPAAVDNALQTRRGIISGTRPLWLSACSHDAAARLARRALTEDLLAKFHATHPVTEDDWTATAARVQRMARAIATRLDRVPIEWTGPPADRNHNHIPASVRSLMTAEDDGQLLITARAETLIRDGAAVRFACTDDPVSHTFIRGWSVNELTAEENGMLAVESALLDELTATQPPSGSQSADDAAALCSRYRNLAEERWATFERHGTIEPTEGLEGVSSYGLEGPDAEAIRELWGRYVQGEAGQPSKVLGLVAIFAWLDVLGEREREAQNRAALMARFPAPVVNMAVVRHLAAEISPTGQRRPPEHVIGVPLALARTITRQVSPAHMVLALQHIVATSHAEWLAGGSGEIVFMPGAEKAVRELGLRGANVHEILLSLAAIRLGQRDDFPGFDLVSNIAETEKQLHETGRPTKGYVFSVGIPLRPLAVRWELERQRVKIPPEYVWSVPLMPAMNMPTAGNANTLSSERAFNAMHLSQFAIEHRTEYTERGVKLTEVIESGAEVYGFTAAHRTKLAESLVGRQRGQSDLFAPFQLVGDGRVQFAPHYGDVHQNILSAAGHSARRQSEQKKGRRKQRKAR